MAQKARHFTLETIICLQNPWCQYPKQNLDILRQKKIFYTQMKQLYICHLESDIDSPSRLFGFKSVFLNAQNVSNVISALYHKAMANAEA
jgi:hypothetical protein